MPAPSPAPVRRPPGASPSAARLVAVLAAALVGVLLLVVGCSGSGDPEDPYAAQRQRLTQQARALGIPDGYPGPQNTGVPLGTDLAESGPVSATEDGQVIENLDITGCVSVKADDVVIRNVRITCTGKQRAVVVEGSHHGLVVEDSEIDGGGSTEVAIGWSGYTMRRVDVHDVVDGPRLGTGVTVQDSWIHDMVREGDEHSDALQSNGGTGIVVRHNTLVPTETSTGDVLNSAIQLGAEADSGLLRDVTIEDNYLDGGNYSVNIRDDEGVSSIVLRENVFGDGSRYGPVLAPKDKVDVEKSNSTRGRAAGVETVEP